jgi:hypothetical protein
MNLGSRTAKAISRGMNLSQGTVKTSSRQINLGWRTVKAIRDRTNLGWRTLSAEPENTPTCTTRSLRHFERSLGQPPRYANGQGASPLPMLTWFSQ